MKIDKSPYYVLEMPALAKAKVTKFYFKGLGRSPEMF